MNRTALSTCISACMFLLILSGWTTSLMLCFGSDVMKWIVSSSQLYAYTLALSSAQGWIWLDQINVICWLLIFVTGGLLATLLTGMVLRSVLDTVSFVLNSTRRLILPGLRR